MTTARTLTPYFCDSLKPAPAGARIFYPDKECPGLFLRVSDTGRRSWLVRRRLNGGKPLKIFADVEYTTGAKGAEPGSVAWARAWARGVLNNMARGIDPRTKRDAERIEQARKQAHTIAAVVADFIRLHASKRRSASEIERNLNLYVVSKWGPLPITDVRRRDVAALLDEIEAGEFKGPGGKKYGGPVMADRVLAAIRKCFNWYATRDDAFVSPIVKGMARTNPKERARSRVLGDDEVRVLWPAFAAAGTFGALCKVLLLTAQRREKVATMTRAQIGADGLWTIPTAPREKNNPGSIILPRAALDVIEAQPAIVGCDYVFPSRAAGPIKGFSDLKEKLDAMAPLPNWTLHDLRRTAKTLMRRAGVSAEISERVLGHVIGGVEGVYDRHDYAAEKQQALKLLADTVMAIVENRHATIIPMKRRKA